MKTSKQIDRETVQITAQVPIDLYFRMKFEAESFGYKDMAKYIRAHFINYFSEKVYGLEDVLKDLKALNDEIGGITNA